MRRKTEAQGLVEFALVLPLFLAMLLGMLDVGRAVWATTVANHAANEAARFAIIHGGTQLNDCPVGPAGSMQKTVLDPSLCTLPDGSPMALSPSKDAIIWWARDAAIGSGQASDVTVDVCYGDGCSGSTDTATDGNSRGTPITVTVTVRTAIVSGSLVGVPQVAMTSKVTMLVNH